MIAAGASIAVIATLLSWPWPGFGPNADERRIADLQRLSHAIEVYRSQHDVLPAILTKLPPDPAAPVHIYDPVTNRPYDYRPLGPLAYELCGRFDAALADEPRDFWWHDAGRQCFALEMRDTAKPKATPGPGDPVAPGSAPPATSPASDDPPPPATPPVTPPAEPPPPAAPPPAGAPPAGPPPAA
jgi:hypothetical protein